MAYSFAIIGGGWYGCHIASSFRSLGFNVVLFEAANRLLNGASGNNQFRLHLGFHYPRHYITRMQSREGFSRFVERYPGLSKLVPENIYAVPKNDSLIDFLTYRIIMTSSGIELVELPTLPSYLTNIEGCLKAGEHVLLTSLARRFFSDRLDGHIRLGHRVDVVDERENGVWVEGERFDFVIDATWGHYAKPPIDLFYEPTMLIYYEARQVFPAVTMVDGPLCSVYPTEDPTIYTLSSVPHTPLGRFATAREAQQAMAAVTGEMVARKAELMEIQIRRYVPEFGDIFKFMGPQLAIKAKPVGSYDDRSCHVFRTGRIFSIMSGKIDTIFFAVERILSMLESAPESEFPQNGGDLRNEIRGRAASLLSS